MFGISRGQARRKGAAASFFRRFDPARGWRAALGTLLLAFAATAAMAEGTYELRAGSAANDTIYLEGYLGSVNLDQQRVTFLRVDILDPASEVIDIYGQNLNNGTDPDIQVWCPGVLPMPTPDNPITLPAADFTGDLGTAGTITSWQDVVDVQDVANHVPGPAPFHAPLTYSLTGSSATCGQAGTYTIRYVTPGSDTSGQQYFDVSVRDVPANTLVRGRVWSDKYALSMGASGKHAKSVFHVVAGDDLGTSYRAVLWKWDLNGMDPYGFQIYANRLGIGPAQYHYMSVGIGASPQPTMDPLYPLYLNTPSKPVDLPALSVSIDQTTTQCDAETGGSQVAITFDADSVYSFAVRVDGDQDGIFDLNEQIASGVTTVGTNVVVWDGQLPNGGGAIQPGQTYDIEVSIAAGEVHFPLFDVEQAGSDASSGGPVITPENVPNTDPADKYFWDDRGPGVGGTPTTSGPDGSTSLHTFEGNNVVNDTWKYATIRRSTTAYTYPLTCARAPKIGLAKAVSPLLDNGDGSFTTTFTFHVVNMGNVTLYGVQVTDDIVAALPSPVTFSVGAASVNAGSGLAINPAFDGSGVTDLLDAGSSTLVLGGSGTVTVPVTFRLNGGAGPYTNIAEAQGTDSASVTVTDTSTDGTDTDPNHDGDPGENTPTPVPLPSADLAITKTDGVTAVMPGDNITYTITVSNAGPQGVVAATVLDTMPAALKNVTWTCVGAGGGSCTASGSGDINDAVDLPALGFVAYTVSATVGDSATGTLTNTATVTAPVDVAEADTGNNSATDTDTIFPFAYDFCPAEPGHSGGVSPIVSVVNGVKLWTYTPPDTVDVPLPAIDHAVAGNLNALMIDPVKNRPLFVQRVGTTTVLWAYDPANGGWYQALAAAVATPDFPRGGMTQAGVGYLIAGNNNTPQVWKVELDAGDPSGFMYTLTQMPGTLTYDNAPTNTSSGDIAFDGNGNGWLSAGQDLYLIDMATLQATRQVRPLLNGNPSTINWAGIAFGDDGKLYVADNTGSSAYYAYDPTTGALTQMAPTGASASRDLASCAFPLPPAAELHAAKTLESVNGVAPSAYVYSGDSLVYAIEVSNTGNAVATLYPADVAETVPANSTHATGDDFTCTPSDTAGAACGNTNAINVPVGGSVTLHFQVTLDETIEGVQQIANAIAVAGVDCSDSSNDCQETSTLGPDLTVDKSHTGDFLQGQVGAEYTINVSNIGGSPTSGTVTVTDTLPAGLTATAISGTGWSCDLPTLTCTRADALASGASYPSIVMTVDVAINAPSSLVNSVEVDGGGETNTANNNDIDETTIDPLPVPSVTVTKTSNPASGNTVTAGQTITYTLTAVVSDAALTADLVLSDTLSAGQTFGSVTAAGDYNVTGAPASFVLPAGTTPGSYAVSYTATVNDDASGNVGNNVTASGGGGTTPSCATCDTTHTVADPSVSVMKTSNPASGNTVTAGQTITYTLTAVVSDAALTADLVLSDTLSAGQTFGSVTAAGDYNVTGAPASFVLPAGTTPGSYAVSYTATVNDDASGNVGNNVTASGGGGTTPSCATCDTTHTVADPSVTVTKTSDPASGSTVTAGQTITYTLTVVVDDAATTAPLTLVDTLGTGLETPTVTDAGSFVPAGFAGSTGTFTLPGGTTPGIYEVVYTAAVADDASGTVGNSVVTDPTDNGGDTTPSCTAAVPCTTSHPLEADVTLAKALASESGTRAGIAEPGEQLTYTITLSNSGGVDAAGVGVTDALDPLTSFVSADNGGSEVAGEVTWAGLTVPAGGTLVLTVQVQVIAPIPAGITQVANLAYLTGSTPPACPPASAQCVVTPTQASVSVTKAVSGESITADGLAEPGEEITYTITVRNDGGTATVDTLVNETVPAHTTFVSGTPGWTCAAGSVAGTACDALVDVPAHDGTQPGVATLTFTVRVDDPLDAGVTTIANGVALDDGTPPDCESLPTYPACAVMPTVNLRLTKTVASVATTGPSAYRVTYQIDVVNLGGSTTTYTLSDTLGFAPGTVFIGQAQVTTTGGAVNPALAGGYFTPANGTTVQLSASGLGITMGATHHYLVGVPYGVQPTALQDAACDGTAGHGLYNAADLAGMFLLDSAACVPVDGSVALIDLVKEVGLLQDADGDHHGDVGDVLGYTFTISNPGTLPLTSVQLFDPRVADLACAPTTNDGQPFRVSSGDELFVSGFEGHVAGGILQPGDAVVCTGSHVLTAAEVADRRVTNSATTTGTGPAGQTVSSVATAIFTQFR